MEKWKQSDSSDSDSVTLTTPIFDFRLIINALTTQYDSVSASDSVASENQPLWFPINDPALCCQQFLCFILHNQSIQMTVVYVSKVSGS